MLAILTAWFALNFAAHAASKTWNAASGSWNYSGTSWLGGVAFASGDDAIFSAATADSGITMALASVTAKSISSGGANTPATMTITGAASDVLTLGTGTAGTGNIADSPTTTSAYAQSLTYTLAGATCGFALAAGSGTTATPTIWDMASGKTFSITASGTTVDTVDLNANTLNLTGAGTVSIGFNNASSIMKSTGGTGTINVNAGTLGLLGGSSAACTIDSSLTVNVASGATLNCTPNTSGGNMHYNMTVNMNGGSLNVGSGNPTVTGPINLNSASTITAGSTTYIGIFNGAIGGSGNLTKSTGNSDTFNGTNTYTGNTTIAGALTIGGNGTLGSGNYAGNITNNGIFTYNSSKAQTLSGVISGTGQLIKTNSTSTLTLTGVNTYTNATTINATGGTLVIGGAGQLNSGNYAGLITNNAALTFNSSAAQTLSGAITGTGTLTKSASSTLTLSGANTYTGPTVANGGVLKLSGGLLDNTAITVSSNATMAVQPGSATTINLGNTATAAAGATLNLGTNTFDMTDGAISTCNLQQEGTFAGAALTMANGARLKFNLGNSSSDLLAVSTAASVSGTINVTLDTSTATSWTGTPTFTILTAASGLNSGTWALTSSTATVGGTFYKFTIAHTATAVTVTATPAYYMIYNGNGSDGGTVPVDTNSPYLTGSTVTVLTPGNLTKTGLAFTNWNTTAGGSGTAYAPGNTFTILANTTNYAQWVTPTATITIASVLPGALTTTYGLASSAQTVSVSGSVLTGNIIAHAPAGLEVSSDGTTYGSTATFVQGGGSVSGTLSVRLVAGDLVSGSYNSLSIYLTTPGAATVNTATTSSGNTVSAKALTVASATAQTKLFDGTTAASVIGVLQTAEAIGSGSSGDGMPYTGDVLTVGCTGSTFSSSALGSWSVTAGTFSLGGTAAGNYTLTQPTLSLSASILGSAVWTNTVALANWGDAVNWTNGIIGTNYNNTADFSQVDLTADAVVNLTTPMTIGNLIFANTDVSPVANWVVSNNATAGNVLTLSAATTPVITVTNLGTGSATISAVVAGISGLNKAGDGTLNLSGVNTYTGNTTIKLGALEVIGAGQLNSGAYAGNITNNGVFVMGSSAAQTLSGVISGSGAVTKSGSGTLTLSGANTYTGGTTNSGGVVVVANAGALGTGPVTFEGGDRVVINDGLTFTNDIVVDVNAINGGVAGRGLLENSGAGNATLSGGTITINSALGGGGDFASTGGGTLTVADPINSASATVLWRTGNGIFSGGGSYANIGITGNLKLGANNGLSTSATATIGASAAATLDLAGFNQTLVGMTKVGANVSIITNSSTTTASTLTTTGTSTYLGAINDGGGAGALALTVNGGQLTITGTNTYTGGTTLAAGILTVSSTETAGTKGPLGKSGTISFTGGTLQYSAANAYDYSPRFSAAAGQTYNIDTAGQTVTFASGLSSSGGTLTLADSTATGTLILSGANSYSGATTVSSGKLYVNGSLNVASAVSVIGGSATLGGQGSAGAVTVSSSGNLEGGQGGLGVLTLTGLAFTDSATVLVTPNITTAPLKVIASNGLNPSGGANAVTINLGGGVLAAGTYHLIQYSGSIQGTGFSAFTLGTTPGGAFTYALANNAGFVDLQVTALADIWTGAKSSEWSINTILSPKNWTVTGVGPVDYADGKDALFDDSATGTTVAISVTDVNPNSVIFNNTTKTYTLQGTKAIAGSIGLQKFGAGTVAINNTNSFTGPVTVGAGTLSVNNVANGGVNSALGAGSSISLSGKLSYTGGTASSDRAVTLNANSTIEVTAAPTALTLAGSVDGAAALIKMGSGTLDLAGTCTYTGNTTISAGTLTVDGTLGGGTYAGNITNNGSFVYDGAFQVGDGVISGPGSVAVTLSGGQLTLNGVNTYAGNTTISSATLAIAGAGQLGAGTYAGSITNNGVLSYNSSAAQSLSGVISGTGSLTKSGAGTLTLSANNSYSGGTTVNAGSGDVTVQNNQTAANGGWAIGVIPAAMTTVNFDAGSTIAIGSSAQLQIGNNVGSGGTSAQTLNVAGTVNDSGILYVGRVGTINLNSGAVWNQSGDMSVNGQGGYDGTLNVNSGSSLIYSGVNTVKVNTADGNNGHGLLNIDGTGSFTTGTGFEQTATPLTTGYGLVKLSNGGTVKLSAAVAALTTQVQFQLDTGGGVLDNNGYDATLSGIVTVGGTRSGIFGTGSLTKKGLGTLTLTGTNTYTGNTIINAGTLALGAGGSIASSPNIVIAGGAKLDVSAAALVLGSGKVLTNSTSTALLNGNITATNAVGGMSLTYASGTPAFTVANGALTLGANTAFKVNNTGAALALGSYKLISAGGGGSVAGAAPAVVTVGGGGLTGGAAASLQIASGELYLAVVQSVNTNSPVLTNSVSGGNVNLSWPADHLGWRLEVQTNTLNVGLNSTWFTWPNSTNATAVSIPINSANPTVFFRLVYP